LEPPNINKRFKEKFGSHTRKNIQQIHYKRQEYFEHHTLYTKYNSLKLEAWVVGITLGSREVPGRKGL
jgi:hypothetical protein